MIVVLKHGYIDGSDKFIDMIASMETIYKMEDIAKEIGVSESTVKRKIREIKNSGLLVAVRYRNNNFIWMIGDDAKENWNGYEALHIAKYRKYINVFNADKYEFDSMTKDEQENILIDIPIFDSDEKELAEDNNSYYRKVRKMLTTDKVEITDELKMYVDNLWKEYRSDTRTNQ